jgi:hypothetical protein
MPWARKVRRGEWGRTARAGAREELVEAVYAYRAVEFMLLGVVGGTACGVPGDVGRCWAKLY